MFIPVLPARLQHLESARRKLANNPIVFLAAAVGLLVPSGIEAFYEGFTQHLLVNAFFSVFPFLFVYTLCRKPVVYDLIFSLFSAAIRSFAIAAFILLVATAIPMSVSGPEYCIYLWAPMSAAGAFFAFYIVERRNS